MLDVGTSTGFFALECARRGASVTAIDLMDDGPLPEIAAGLGLTVEYLQMNLYDLSPKIGAFDLVICGSVLLHLWDPFNALRSIASVCQSQAIVATTTMPKALVKTDRPIAELVAVHAEEGDYWTTWHFSAAAMEKMMRAAGFSKVKHQADFELKSVPGGHDYRVHHGVFHGFMQ